MQIQMAAEVTNRGLMTLFDGNFILSVLLTASVSFLATRQQLNYIKRFRFDYLIYQLIM